MAFMKNINDLIGILTLMVLILPSRAANIDCNGKPFYCVNSTHFRICVDLGSGVSSTIDDFVIACPPTTVCQGTNRFECELPAVTTTTLTPLVVPFATTVSETTGIATTTLYDVSTSIPFEEYFNTLSSTTLSEDALIAEQATATESTIQLVTGVIQNIEVIIPGPGSNSTLNETISSPSVVQNVFTTHTPLLDNISASATDIIPDNTEKTNLKLLPESEPNLNLNETIPSVAVAQNDLTVTIIKKLNNDTQNTEVIQNGPEPNTTLNETISSAIVDQNVFTTHTPLLDSLGAIATNLITPESKANLNETIPSVAVLRNDLTVTTITPLTNATQNVEVIIPRPESNSTLNETFSSVNIVHNALITDNILFENIRSSTTDLIPEVTENISVMPRFETDLILNKTISNVSVIRNDLTNATIIPLSNNIRDNVIDLIANTENVNVIIPGLELNSTRITNINDNATDLIPDVTKNVNVFIPEANSFNKTIQRPRNIDQNDTASIYTLHSTSMTNNLADTVTESILTEVAETTPSVSINVIQNLTTNNTPINTALPDKIVDIIFTERIANEVTDSINVTKSITENKLIGAVEFEQNYLKTKLSLNNTTSPSNLEKIATEPVITEMADIINPVKPEFNTIMDKTFRSKSENLIQNDLATQKPLVNTFISNILTEATATGIIENINVTTAVSNLTLNEFTTSMPVATEVIENSFKTLNIPNITLPSSIIITTPIVIAMASSLNLTTESINKTLSVTTTTVSNDIVSNYDVSTYNSSGTASLNSTNDVTKSIIDVDTKNTNDTETESDLNQTSSRSLLSEPVKNILNDISSLYTQSSTAAIPNKTELISSDDILNKLGNEINKPNTTGNNDGNVTGEKISTNYMNSSATSEDYQASSTVTNSSDIFDFVETTSNSILETSVSAQEVEVLTYNNVYKENNVNDQGIMKATNQTNGKSMLSQALPTGTVENKTLTPAITVISNKNIFSSSSISNTDAPLSNSSEVTSGSTFEYDTSLRNKTNDNKILASNGTTTLFQIENGSELPVNTTSLELVHAFEKHEEPSYSIEALLLSNLPTEASADNIIEKPVLNESDLLTATNSPVDSTIPNIDITVKLPVVIDHVNESKTMERTTLATTSSVTETSKPFYLEKFNITSASKMAKTESAVLQDILTSPLKEAVTIATISKIISDSSNSLSLNKSINVDQPTKEEAMLHTVKTEIMHAEGAVPVLNLTTKVTAPEVAKNSYVESPFKVKSVNDKTNNILDLTQNTSSSLLVSNDVLEILTVANNISDLTTNAPDVGNSEFEIIPILNTAQQEISNIIAPELITSLIQTELPVLSPTKIEAITRTPEGEYSATSVTEPYFSENKIDLTTANDDVNVLTENTLSTVNIGVEAAKENSPLLNLLLNSSVEQRQYKAPTVSNTKILLESTSIQKETLSSSLTNILPASGDLSSKDNLVPGRSTLQKPYSESTTNGIDANVNKSTTNETVIYEGAYIVERTVPETNKVSDTLNHNQIHDYINITQGIPINVIGKTQLVVPNESVSGNSETETTNINEKNILPNQVTDTITDISYILIKPASVSKSSQDTMALNSQMSQRADFSSQTEITYNTSVTLSQTNVAPIQNMNFSNTQTTESITKPWRATAVTNPFQITSQSIAKQPIIELTSTEPYTKSTQVSDNTMLSAHRPNGNYVGSNPETQYINVIEKAVVSVKSSTGLAGESSSITQTSKMSVQTVSKSELNNNNTLQEPPNISKNKKVDTKAVQLIMPNPLGSNPNASHVVEINDQVFLENNLQASTHSGISLTKPTEKPNVDLNKKVKSESVEKHEGETGKEKEITSENVIDVPNNVTPAISTTVSALFNSKDPKPGPDLVNEPSINVLVDLTGTPRTVDYKLPFINDKSPLETTSEITTKKLDTSLDRAYKSINNIELLSLTTVKSIENFEQKTVAHLLPKEILNDSIIITAHIASNVTSNIKNSTAHTTPVKLPIAKTHNASLTHFTALESATNSNNFVCKSSSRGRFSDSKDCRKFYICIGRHEPIEGFCPNNTVFSELRKQCTKNLSHCIRNNQFLCVWEGRFNDYLNDNIYYICVKNNVGKFVRFKLQCQSGYHLNKTSVRCALNTKSIQSTSEQSTSETKNSSDQSVFSVNSETVDVESNEKFECEEEGKFSDENDCRKYYICTKKGKSQYVLNIKKCDSDELFHKYKKKCVDADSYECS